MRNIILLSKIILQKFLSKYIYIYIKQHIPKAFQIRIHTTQLSFQWFNLRPRIWPTLRPYPTVSSIRIIRVHVAIKQPMMSKIQSSYEEQSYFNNLLFQT